MNNNRQGPEFSKKSAAARKLAENTARYTAANKGLSSGDEDMLSLVISGALQGENISDRYPAFYDRLLQDAGLRQAFIDALQSIEDERAHKLIELPGGLDANLDFLRDSVTSGKLEKTGIGSWRLTWERAVSEIERIFLPPELAYRSDLTLFEDVWFTLVRAEANVEGVVYVLALECAPTDDQADMLQAVLNVAVTGIAAESKIFPLQATIHWAAYNASVEVFAEGPTRFPNIPLRAILEEQGQHVAGGLVLTVERNA